MGPAVNFSLPDAGSEDQFALVMFEDIGDQKKVESSYHNYQEKLRSVALNYLWPKRGNVCVWPTASTIMSGRFKRGPNEARSPAEGAHHRPDRSHR